MQELASYCMQQTSHLRFRQVFFELSQRVQLSTIYAGKLLNEEGFFLATRAEEVEGRRQKEEED